MLHFKTSRGNVYSYDDSTGGVRSLAMAQEESTAGPRQDTERHQRQPSVSLLSDYLRAEGFRQLILVSTHRCNLRCLYCSYSGSYTNSRTHANVDLSRDVAQRAIDVYVRGFAKTKESNPYRIPTVGFYGGEPLLAPELLESAVEHCQRRFTGPIHFALTTNGVCVDRALARYLASNGFSVSVSLNGPEEEHDRLRTDGTGSGSFARTWRGIRMLRDAYGDQFRESCTLLACYDVGTDFREVDRFFRENGEWLPPIGRVSPVSPHFTEWYAQYAESERRSSERRLKRCRETYYLQLLRHERPSSYFDRLFGDILRVILMRSQRCAHRPLTLPYTGACIPGEKVAVAPDGKLHACEKMNESLPIGDVDAGLSLPRIAETVSQYRREITDQCADCSISRLCPVCYALVQTGSGFAKDPSDLCEKLVGDFRDRFSELWSLLEGGVAGAEILGRQGGQE